MANIVFLADGTWNGPGQTNEVAQTTNVFKLFSLLDGADELATLALAKEQERMLRSSDGALVQVAKYLHGVGDSENALVRMLGGAFGAGVIARIVRGYTFISRNHRDDNDRIFIVGFSRGAYTARSLAGLISARGLLRPEDCADHERAYRAGCAVWAEYRAERNEDPRKQSLLDVVLSNLPSFLDPASARAEKPTLPLRKTDVACVAVWDTVGALGIPIYDGDDSRKDVFSFCDCALSGKVLKGYHAVALNERRVDFTPTLWDSRDGITQMLFAGAHADVGGGYPLTNDESGLSHESLRWVADVLEGEGLRLREKASDVYPASPYAPSHQPWTEFPWKLTPNGTRSFTREHRLQVHPSLTLRRARQRTFRVLPSGTDEPFDDSNLPAALS
jgi:hypothetical protein